MSAASSVAQRALAITALGVSRALLPAISITSIVVIWELAVAMVGTPAYILPAPSLIAHRIVADLMSGDVAPHFMTTFIEVLSGISIATVIGLSIGTMIGISPTIEKILYPIILIVQTVPKVAIAPLVIIWFGYGISSKIATAALLAFFPVLVNVIAGIKAVDTRRITLMRMLCASSLQIYFKVRLPNMLFYLFAGLEIGVVLGLIGAIVGEFVGASVGLGSLIIQRQSQVDVAGVFSVLAYLSSMGLALTITIKALGKKIAFWGG